MVPGSSFTTWAEGKVKLWGALSPFPWPWEKRLMDCFPWISGHDALLGDFVSKTTVAKKDWFSLGTIALLFLYSKPSVSTVRTVREALGAPNPGGNGETRRQSHSNHQEGVCSLTWTAQSSRSLRTCMHSANTGPEIALVSLFGTCFQTNSKA